MTAFRWMIERQPPHQMRLRVGSYPSILDCAVVGIAHEHLGKVPIAFVVRRDGREVDAAVLLVHCGQHRSAYKVSVAVHLVDEIPRTGSGKVMRFRLRESIEAQHSATAGARSCCHKRCHCAGMAHSRRGNHASGTPSVRPSGRSNNIAWSSKRRMLAERVVLRIIHHIPIPFDYALPFGRAPGVETDAVRDPRGRVEPEFRLGVAAQRANLDRLARIAFVQKEEERDAAIAKHDRHDLMSASAGGCRDEDWHDPMSGTVQVRLVPHVVDFGVDL